METSNTTISIEYAKYAGTRRDENIIWQNKNNMIYLIHFERKLKHAQHYLGFCEDGNLEKRIERHRKGSGAKILRACVENGIEFKVVRVWEDGDRNFERMLKNKKNSRLLCPICNKENYKNNGEEQ